MKHGDVAHRGHVCWGEVPVSGTAKGGDGGERSFQAIVTKEAGVEEMRDRSGYRCTASRGEHRAATRQRYAPESIVRDGQQWIHTAEACGIDRRINRTKRREVTSARASAIP